MRTREGEKVGQRSEAVAIGVAVLFAVLAVAGYATFGRHPGLVRAEVAWVYAAAFKVFAQGQVWVTAVAFLFVLWKRAGWKWVGALAACYAISLVSELVGTTYGVPFGAYTYSSTLGPMWLSRVPIIIPLSWFLMALPSYALASLVTPFSAVKRVLLGSFILLGWDLVLDPAMSYFTKYWQWAEPGPYFGMPLLNLFGWYVTGLALLAALHAFDVVKWTANVPTRIWASFYVANLIVPGGIVVFS